MTSSPPQPLNARPHRPPPAPLPLIGRADALDALSVQVERAAWVCVTGPPGVGKSRLAQELSVRLDDLVWVSLAGASRPMTVTLELAAALGLNVAEAREGDEAMRQLALALEARQARALVLDGVDALTSTLEQTLAPLRRHAPELALICTSRQMIPCAHVTHLSLPALDEEDAIALFEARAQRARRDFTLDAPTREVVAQLTRHLDGLPLAIMLAASRVNLLGPAELLRRLARRFQLLRDAESSSSSGPQSSLGGALALSWQALDASQQRALSRLSVFCGPLSLDAAETILGDDDEAPDALALLDVLESLTRSSLLVSEPSARFAGEVRLRLLESVREYVRLHHPPPDWDALRDAHARYYLDAATRWRASLALQTHAREARGRLIEARAQLECVASRLPEDDAAQLDAALALDALYASVGGVEAHQAMLLTAHQRQPTCGELLLAMGELALVRGQPAEAARWLAQAAARLGPDAAPRALVLSAEAARLCGRAEESAALLRALQAPHEPSLARLRCAYLAAALMDCGDREGSAAASAELSAIAPGARWRDEAEVARREAYVCYYQGQLERQRQAHQRVARLAAEVDSAPLAARAAQGLGEADFALGDWASAASALERAAAQLAAQGQAGLAAICRGNLGAAWHRLGRFEEAHRAYVSALEDHRALGAPLYEGIVLLALGALAHEREQVAQARRYYQLARDHHRAHGQREDAAAAALCWGWLELELARDEQAQALLREACEGFEAAHSQGWAAVARQRLGGAARSAPEQGLARFLWQVLDASPEPTRALRLDPRASGTLYGRLALRLSASGDVLEVGAEASDPSQRQGPALRLGAGVMWFAVDDSEVVNLSRRKALRLVLDALVKARQAQPGVGIGVYELFELGWPGQVIAPEQSCERVYWAIRTLRQLGLEGALVTLDEGYALEPSVSLVWEDVL